MPATERTATDFHERWINIWCDERDEADVDKLNFNLKHIFCGKYDLRQMGPDGNCFTLRTGAKMPAVGLGTWQAEGESCKAAVRIALECGYRHIDCAHLYGNEIEVGEALAEALAGGIPGLRREDLFITSKLWCTTNAPRHVETAAAVSVKNLGLSYLDLYLVHWPLISPIGDATDPPRKASVEHRELSRQIKATWHAMEALVETNKVLAIGVSNFNIQQLEELLRFCKIIPAVNQVELHPLWRQDELMKYCETKGIHVSAHTPLGIPATSVTGCTSATSAAAEGEAPSAFMRSQSVHAPMLKTSVVAAIAQRLGKTPAQVILRWAVQRGTSVLPRSLREERIRSNIDILNWSLSNEEWNAINKMEPQVRLIDSSYSYLSENVPLQVVKESEDDDDDE